MSSTHVNFLNPVPTDIEVSQSITPVPIGEIAAAAGCLPEEVSSELSRAVCMCF